MSLDPELRENIAKAQEQRRELLAQQPRRPLDDLAHVLSGDPQDPGYLAMVRDLVADEPQATEQAQLLWTDPMLRDGLTALLRAYEECLAPKPNPQVLSDCSLRFAQGVAATPLLGPAARIKLGGSLQEAMSQWLELGRAGDTA